MPEAFKFDQLAAQPIMGTWSLEGGNEEHLGFLCSDGDHLNLRLYLTLPGHASPGAHNTPDPRLLPFEPPKQPTIHGRTKAVGHVTLFNCARIHYQSTVQLNPVQTRAELTLRPAEAWVGGGFVSNQAKYGQLSFLAPGLHNILSTIHIDHQFLAESRPKHKSATHKLKKLTGAQEAFLIYQQEQPKAQVLWRGNSYEVAMASSIAQSASSVSGVSISTSDHVYITSQSSDLAELSNVSFQVEQFLALLCMGPFRAEGIRLQLDAMRQAERFWKLGVPANRAAFKLLPHQTLVALGRHPQLTQSALDRWFSASSSTQLARWLMYDSLFSEVSSTSKFLSVAQAWELSGREESKVAPYNKKIFRKLCGDISKIIEGQLDKEAADRLINLMRSSNRESFGDLIKNTAKKVPQLALDAICGDLNRFVSVVVDVRNVLTHMQGKKKMSLEAASYLCMFLTYKLTALYCIHAATTIGLPLDNLAMMLANNSMARMACRPLPEI